MTTTLSAPARTVGVTVVGVGAAALYILYTVREMATGTFAVWGGLVALPLLVLLSVPLLRGAYRREPDPRLQRLIMFAFALKVGAALPRYWMAFGLYDGESDAGGYNEAGQHIANSIWSGRPTFDVGPIVGTGFVRLLTGLIYTVTGPSILTGFLIFSWFGFWGLYLFYRAFVLALPTGDAALYAKLVLLLPSLLFWSSSIGKESVITLTLGVGVYGAARILTWSPGGFPLLVVGLAGTAVIRPHIALLLFLGTAAAYLLRRARPDATVFTPIAKAAGVVVLLVIGVLVINYAQAFLGVDSLNSQAVSGWLDETAKRTDQGGSAFTVLGQGTPLQYPLAIITVLFRPLPFEAPNLQAFVTSLESVLLLGIVFWQRGRLLSIFADLRRRPYVALCLVFTLLFCFAFSQISNFGIIARQRVQVLPFALVLVCARTRRELSKAEHAVPATEPAGAGRPGPTSTTPINGWSLPPGPAGSV
jgi:hypothetical protein